VTDTRYLVHGVFWDGPPAVSAASDGAASDGGRPVLRLQHRSGGFTEMTQVPDLPTGRRYPVVGGFAIAFLGAHSLTG
jgi:hypothetical protein